MKNNELLTLILEELTKLNGEPKPVGLVPPPFVKTMLTSGLQCEQYLYTRALGHGNLAHRIFVRCILPNKHASALHETNVFGTMINWYSE